MQAGTSSATRARPVSYHSTDSRAAPARESHRMTINYEKLINWKIPEVVQQFTKRDTMLFALGVGLGADPCDTDQLKFVYEQSLQALPAMATILGYPGPWHAQGDTGITRSHVVHGEQSFTIHKPLPVEGTIVGLTRITGVVDKG